MSKRLIRIPANELVVSTKNLMGKLASVVLKTGAVSIGYVKQVDEKSITLKTKRSSTLQFQFNEIIEIILDSPKDAAIASS